MSGWQNFEWSWKLEKYINTDLLYNLIYSYWLMGFVLDVFLSALSLAPEQAEQSPWLSPVLVLPVLQLLSCSELTEPLADRRTHKLNHSLAHSLLRRVSKQTNKPRQVTLSTSCSCRWLQTRVFVSGWKLIVRHSPASHTVTQDQVQSVRTNQSQDVWGKFELWL